jgi:hypothetical protein
MSTNHSTPSTNDTQSTNHETMTMSERALELIKELQRKPDSIPQYNDEGVRRVLDEIDVLAGDNQRDVQVSDGLWLFFV